MKDENFKKMTLGEGEGGGGSKGKKVLQDSILSTRHRRQERKKKKPSQGSDRTILRLAGGYLKTVFQHTAQFDHPGPRPAGFSVEKVAWEEYMLAGPKRQDMDSSKGWKKKKLKGVIVLWVGGWEGVGGWFSLLLWAQHRRQNNRGTDLATRGSKCKKSSYNKKGGLKRGTMGTRSQLRAPCLG